MVSRFAVLKIEGDSDEDNGWVAAGAGNNKKGPQQKGKPGQANKNGQKSGNLIVHAVERQRPKPKKNNKEKVVDPATGLVVRDGDFGEDAKKEKVRQALAASSFPAPESKSPSEERETAQNGVPPPPNLGNELDSEVRRLNLQSADQNELSRFYKNRLVEVMKELNAAKEETTRFQGRVDYYKDRYKKLVELFKDAECYEKAKLVMEVEAANTTVADLTIQLNQVTKSLEQTRSRLSAYEGKR